RRPDRTCRRPRRCEWKPWVYLGCSAGFVKKLKHLCQRVFDRLSAHRLAVAGKMPRFRSRSAVFLCPREAHRAYGLVAAAARGTGDAGDGERHRAAAALERTERHVARGLFADGAMPLDGVGAHAEHLLLGLVRIGDEAALE